MLIQRFKVVTKLSLTGDTRKIFVSNIREIFKTVDESNFELGARLGRL